MEARDTPDTEEGEEFRKRLDVLTLVAQTMAHSANEVLLLAHLESKFDPKPANIRGTDDQIRELRDHTNRVVEALGGPPRLIVTGPNGKRKRYDTYAAAAIDEAILMFQRARSAVCRTHLHFIAGSMIEREPEMLKGWPADEGIKAIVQRLAIEGFWEYAESSYVKLASLWDRLGQLLDFAFFNIRQYERDGFPAVVDRIAANYVPLSLRFSESSSWQAVRLYQTSEKADGLKWLLRRRNLIIHSLHLRPSPLENEAGDPLFDGAYNHLEQSMKRRLATRSRDEELAQLHRHLTQAASLFGDVLTLCEFGATGRKTTLDE